MEKIISKVREAVSRFRETDKNKVVRIITHYDADGITAGAILVKALQRADRKFRLSIVKQLEDSVLKEVAQEACDYDAIFFLDLSGNFKIIKNINTKIFVLDHHEVDDDAYESGIVFVNPFLLGKENEISGAGLTYLFAKELNERNKDLSDIAILGMVGDMLGRSISKINNSILNESNVSVKKGIPLFSSTRPLHKALEFSSSVFIPGVTGSPSGVLNLLRESGIKTDSNKTLLSLSKEELSRLITSIVLRRIGKSDADSILGNIYILKFFNRTEDARELSTLINACGRLGYGDVALALCLGSAEAKEIAEDVSRDYKNFLIEGLNYVEKSEKTEGKGYVIFNCKSSVRDSIIGVIISILASSFIYEDGKVIAGLAYRDDGKIKVSARVSRKDFKEYGESEKYGENEKYEENKESKINLKELLCKVCKDIDIDGSAGGHVNAAGCLIPVAMEEAFINALEQNLNELKK